MLQSIKNILGSFKIKVSPEKQISLALKEFFKERGATIPAGLSIYYANGVIKVSGDPYVSSYIKINNGEVLSYLKTSFPSQKIERLE